MKGWKNPTVAALILAACMLLSTVFGCWRSVHTLRQQAEQIFFSGAAGDGIGIASDLSARRDAAVNLVTVGRRYLPEGEEHLQQVEQAVLNLDAAQTIGEKVEANRRLGGAAHQLSDRLASANLSDSDENYWQNLLAEMNSRAATMSHDTYNDAAQRYNQTLESLPAGFFGRLLGLAPLELFR